MAVLRVVRQPGRRLTSSSGTPSTPGFAALLRPLLGALLLAGLLPSAGCGEGTGESADPHRELRERLDLDADREIHRVSLGGRGAEEHVVPSRLRVGPRAVVEFVAVDGRVHTVSFAEDSLAPDAARFLRRTSQLRSPPLVDRGARFVLSFQGAPGGRYPYRIEGPGGEAWGAILVEGSSR